MGVMERGFGVMEEKGRVVRRKVRMKMGMNMKMKVRMGMNGRKMNS